VAVVLIELIRRLGRIEPGAAMGVVFTSMFAAGVLLLEQSDTSTVHLDGYGWAALTGITALAGLPPELLRISLTLVFVVLFMVLFWRPLKLSTFDEGFARTFGLQTGILGLALVIVAVIAAVAAFDAVGSIIVIAMFICPPAAARLMTNQLEHQIGRSVVFDIISVVLGYVIAGYGPLWLGFDNAVSAAGMIATISRLDLGDYGSDWPLPHTFRCPGRGVIYCGRPGVFEYLRKNERGIQGACFKLFARAFKPPVRASSERITSTGTACDCSAIA